MARWTQDDVRTAATAIANARGNRRGFPAIRNILDVLPKKLREEVLDDAMAVARALDVAPVDGRPEV